MINHFFLIPLVFLLCSTFSCQNRDKTTSNKLEVNIEADIAAIKASFDEFVQLYNANNFDRIMSIFYIENSIQMPPNESIRKGKAAILLGYHKTRELNDEHIDYSVIEDVRVSGDMAVVRGLDTGTTTPRSGGKPVKYNMKWLTILERQPDGTWKWIYEIWNENNPFPETLEKE
jgi:ketosteroid isomerase-like protein